MSDDQLAAWYAAIRERLELPPDTVERRKERELLGLPADTDMLVKLTALAEEVLPDTDDSRARPAEHKRLDGDRVELIRASWRVLDEYGTDPPIEDTRPTVRREIDGDPLRGRSGDLRQLAARVAATRRQMRKVQERTGFTMEDDALAEIERRAREFLAASQKVVDRPTEDAKVYAITQLLDIVENCGAPAPGRFVIAALAIIGEKCSVNKVDKIRRAHTLLRHRANCLACRQARSRAGGAWPAACPAGSLLADEFKDDDED